MRPWFGTLWFLIAVLFLVTVTPGDRAHAEGPPATAAPAAAAPAAAGGPVPVKVGLFVTQLYDFDMPKRAFNATFWAWYLHSDEKYKPLETIEVVNAKTASVKFSAIDTTKNIQWAQGKYAATLSEDWNIANFPFDRQNLHIVLEDGQADASEIKLIADSTASRIDDSVRIPGWTIEKFSIESGDTTYATTYGDPTLQGSSVYSRVTAIITIKRDGVRLLLSMFIGFAVAFLLVELSFFLDFDSMAGSRIGLCAAAVFAAVGNKYVVDSYLPPASTFTLADVIEATTFATIILAALTVVVIQVLRPRHPRLAILFNRLMALGMPAAFVAINGFMIARAVAG